MFRSIRFGLAAIFLSLAGPGFALPNHGSRHTQDAHPAEVQGAPAIPKPDFVIEAEKDLENAELALQTEQRLLMQLRQEEAKLRQAAVAATGSWIEPAELWKKKQSIKESIEIKQQAVANARRHLTRAENKALTSTESNWNRRHHPSWLRSWWQW
jgi:hypothetical protein